jgi:hypothetical protein
MGNSNVLVSFPDTTAGRHACLLCWLPPEFSAETCDAVSAQGNFCTREPGHDGGHAACGPRPFDHPIYIWEDDEHGDSPNER